MDFDNLGNKGHLADIPKELFSKITGEAIKNCTFCDAEVYESGKDYYIEKVVKRYPSLNSEDVIIEYAICDDCMTDVFSSFSEDSRKTLEKFFMDRASYENSNFNKYTEGNFDFKDWTRKCALTGQSLEDLGEYNIIAQCRGSKLIYFVSPMIIDSSAMEELHPLLSQSTKDKYDDFVDKLTTPPEEFKDLLKDKPFIFI